MIARANFGNVEVSPELGLSTFIVESHQAGEDVKVRVVRDDLLINRGGTKRRTLESLMPSIKKGEIVYSATPFGYGQVAIADACNDFNKSATIFVPKIGISSIFTSAARDLGANIVEIQLKDGDTFSKITDAAKAYASDNENVRELCQSGFDSDNFSRVTANLIGEHLNLSKPVEEVWCIAGSGALSRSLQKVWPKALHNVVRVRSQDSVYGVDCDPGDAKVYDALEEFSEAAQELPPFPSSANYDAKIWSYVKKHACDGALVWNM